MYFINHKIPNQKINYLKIKLKNIIIIQNIIK